MNDKLKHIVIDYLNKEYSGLIPYETDKWSDFIFFMKNGEVIFDYNNKNGYVYISYDNIWSFLESFFGLEYEEIQDLTKQWVEEHYNLDVTTTLYEKDYFINKVEEHYNLDVTTTKIGSDYRVDLVEEHYKLETNG